MWYFCGRNYHLFTRKNSLPVPYGTWYLVPVCWYIFTLLVYLYVPSWVCKYECVRINFIAAMSARYMVPGTRYLVTTAHRHHP